MKIRQGIKLLDEKIGDGSEVKSGDYVEYDLTISLNKGEVIEWTVDGQKVTKLSYQSEVARNRMINGIYYSCIGMKENGYRKVKVAPIWGYGEKALEGRIPPNAVLIIELWIKRIIQVAA